MWSTEASAMSEAPPGAIWRLMGRGMERGLPETVRNLARLAEEREGDRS